MSGWPLVWKTCWQSWRCCRGIERNVGIGEKLWRNFVGGNGFLLTWSSVAVSVFGRLLWALHRPIVKDFFCLFFIASILRWNLQRSYSTNDKKNIPDIGIMPLGNCWGKFYNARRAVALHNRWSSCTRTLSELNTQGEVTSQSLWSRYDRHFVGVAWHSVWS